MPIQANKKLGAGGIGILRSSHRQNAGLMRRRIELRFDLIPRAACARPLRASALDHESFDDSMKNYTVIKADLSQAQEILDMTRGQVRQEVEPNLAFVRG
jgi:hypothetical protein